MRFGELFRPNAPGSPAKEAAPSPPPSPILSPEAPPPSAPVQTSIPESARLELVEKILDTMNRLKEAVLQSEPIPFDELKASADQLLEAVNQNEQDFVGSALFQGQDDYLLRHPCNTAILTILLGKGVAYKIDYLRQLTLSALLHNVGIFKMLHLVDQPRSLTPIELKELRKHPTYGEEILKTCPDIPRLVLVVTAQSHERLDGTGYPRGLKDGETCEEARLVGLACAFEALTHSRPHRPGSTVLKAMELLTGELRSSFDPHLTKLLLKSVGLYPKGQWVELSTGEQGRVIGSDPSSLTRPTVEILKDLYGRPYPQLKRIDLKIHPTLSISRVLPVPSSAEASP